MTQGRGGDGTWVQVERRDLVIGVEVEGELRSPDSSLLGPPANPNQWNFTITFMAPEGMDVQPGVPVIRFDTSNMQRLLQEKMAEKNSAGKELERKTTDLEISRRDKELQLAQAQADFRLSEFKVDVPETAVSNRELEEARIERRMALRQIEFLEQQLESARLQGEAELASLSERLNQTAARVEEIQEQIHEATVGAPRKGTVVYVTNWRGEKKKVGDTVWRGEKIVQIPDLSRMVADGQVDEANAGRLAAGQAVTLRLDAFPDQEYRGEVRSIRRTVQRKSWRNPQKVVQLEIDLKETDVEKMRPGMRFRGSIEIERLSRILALPLDAVRVGADGPEVFLRGALEPRRVKPELGRRSNDYIQVLSGLEEGERVLLPTAEEGGS